MLRGPLVALLVVLALAGPVCAQQDVRIGTPGKGSTAPANPTSTSIDANHTGLDVNIVAGGSSGGTTTLQQGTTVTAGRQVVTTTPTALPTVTAKWVVVRALNTNVSGAFVDVGGSAVTAGAGFPLAPGDETPPMFITNVNEVYVVGPSGVGSVAWLITSN